MAKYRKKPVVIHAVQFIPEITTPTKVKKELEIDYDPVIMSLDGYYVESKEGVVKLEEGNYIMKGVEGEVYVCDQDIFYKTYDKVTEEEGDEPLGKEK